MNLNLKRFPEKGIASQLKISNSMANTNYFLCEMGEDERPAIPQESKSAHLDGLRRALSDRDGYAGRVDASYRFLLKRIPPGVLSSPSPYTLCNRLFK
jgi:hypothetical protein